MQVEYHKLSKFPLQNNIEDPQMEEQFFYFKKK